MFSMGEPPNSGLLVDHSEDEAWISETNRWLWWGRYPKSRPLWKKVGWSHKDVSNIATLSLRNDDIYDEMESLHVGKWDRLRQLRQSAGFYPPRSYAGKDPWVSCRCSLRNLDARRRLGRSGSAFGRTMCGDTEGNQFGRGMWMFISSGPVMVNDWNLRVGDGWKHLSIIMFRSTSKNSKMDKIW